MTRKSTLFRPGSEAIRRRILLARLFLAVERIWPLLWPAGGFVCLFLLLAWSGMLPLLSWPLHALILAICVSAIALSLALAARGFRWPGKTEAARRLERDSQLEHRPLSEAEDQIAAGRDDPEAEALWALHAAQLPEIRKLRLCLPEMRLKDRDPWRLRYGALALLIIGICIAGHQWESRLIAALGPAGYVTPSVDAWIEPPPYTGVAPVYLNARQKLSIPAGSKLNIRVHGADRAPFLSVRGIRFPWLPISSRLLSGANGEYATEVIVGHTAEIRVRAIGRTIGRWGITVVPDAPPAIRLTAMPKASEQKTLQFSFAASDDYGVTGVRAILTPVDGHGAPLSVDLQITPSKNIAQTIYRDLTSHPYAGLKVHVTLEARDGAGQVSRTKSVVVQLPQLIFTDPLAKSLIELRQHLAQDGLKARRSVGQTLDALAIAPEHFYEGQLTTWLVVRDARWALKMAEGPEDLERIEDLLWQAALKREHGGARSLADQLRQLERAISQAMASGASQDDINALLSRYHETMQQYLRAMGQGASGNDTAEKQPGGKVLAEKDLDDLIRAIQTLAESGDRERAAKLLSFLQNLIENMQVTGGGSGGSGESAADRQLRDLSDLAAQQRQLLDKTFRQRQGNPKSRNAGDLARNQGALSRSLEGMLQSWKNAPKDLRDAQRKMQDAEQALRSGDLERAGASQKNALEALRKAAGELAKQGNAQDAGRQAPGVDPFGRAGGAAGNGTPLPDQNAMKRLRDILDELRKKAGENNRPQEERDYIERLLKQF